MEWYDHRENARDRITTGAAIALTVAACVLAAQWLGPAAQTPTAAAGNAAPAASAQTPSAESTVPMPASAASGEASAPGAPEAVEKPREASACVRPATEG